MSDGVQLVANVFRSFKPARSSVLMSVTPYGKNTLPDRQGKLLMRLAGTRFGQLDCSAWTGFEVPDPLFWVRVGYAVVQADVRGMHKLEGHASVLSDRDAQDYYELIEWTISQSWSPGVVGQLSVSYLAMSQRRVAVLRSPSLRSHNIGIPNDEQAGCLDRTNGFHWPVLRFAIQLLLPGKEPREILRMRGDADVFIIKEGLDHMYTDPPLRSNFGPCSRHQHFSTGVLVVP